MEEIKSEEMYMEDLDGWILEENKVSVRSLSFKMPILGSCILTILGGYLQVPFASSGCACEHSKANALELQGVEARGLQGCCLFCLRIGE